MTVFVQVRIGCRHGRGRGEDVSLHRRVVVVVRNVVSYSAKDERVLDWGSMSVHGIAQ